jgi:hypothetical protein
MRNTSKTPIFFIRNRGIIIICIISTVLSFQLFYHTSLSGIYKVSAIIPLPLTNQSLGLYYENIDLIVKQYVDQKKNNINFNNKYYPDIFYLGNKTQIFIVNNSILIRAIDQSEIDSTFKVMEYYKALKLLILKFIDLEISNLSTITKNNKYFISQVKDMDDNQTNQIFSYLIFKEVNTVMNKISQNENTIKNLKNYREILLKDYEIKSTLVFNSAYFFLYLGIFFGALLGLIISFCYEKFQHIKFFYGEQ